MKKKDPNDRNFSTGQPKIVNVPVKVMRHSSVMWRVPKKKTTK